MPSHKLPISKGLTSFVTTEQGCRHTGEPGKLHRLPAANWKALRSSVATPLDQAIVLARDFFLREQLPGGYWWAELESNVTITAEYLMLFHFLGMADHGREQKIAAYLLRQQTPEGSWTIYHGGPGDLSTTIEAYFALKLAGFSPDHPSLKKAREFILSQGGIPKSRVFTKMFLALFGEFSWHGVPSMPIELMLLPEWAYFNIYSFSSWSRATIVPLSVTMTLRPVKKISPAARIQELYLRPPRRTDYTFTREHGIFSWKNFFIGVDHFLKIYEESPLRPGRRRATNRAEQWLLEHQESAGDWGGIQPASLNSIIALHCLGYANNHPVIVKGLRALDSFCLEDDDSLRLQSCISPTWDTALAMKALLSADVPGNHPSLVLSAEWLLDREVRTPGDWQVKAADLPPGGWAFEFRNDLYPDVDDTAFVMLALKDVSLPEESSRDDAIARGIAWCLGLQSHNGGWGAFDKNNTRHLLNKIPFADLEALIDPPTADLTGRILELLGNFGFTRHHPQAVKALRFIRETQEPEGPWWGRWGVNYIYGTWSVLTGLEAIGEDLSATYVRKAVEWLFSVQNSDGGWGETCASYHDRFLMGSGTSTPSQTGWALLALMAAGETGSAAVSKGIAYLIATQKPDGTWDEQEFTGTGFPKYFMIRYHIYRTCFPLTALGTYRTKTAGI